MSGRSAPRSKSGCSTCRRRKVKCDETRPACRRCLHLALDCEWGIAVNRRRDGINAAVAVRPLQPAQPRWTSPIDRESLKEIRFPLATHYANPPTTLWPVPADWSTSPSLPYSPLYNQLSEPNIPCANSLTLSDLDKKYFQFFPSSSVVFYYMKKWKWSSFNYLYSGPAASHKVIMRMIMAMSASDMHRNGLVVRSPGRPSAEDHARYHYGTAVKEFRQLLDTQERQLTGEDLEMLFVTMFLMITYEWQFGHNVGHLQLHLLGVRSLLETHPELMRMKDVHDMLLEPDSEQLNEPVGQVSLIPEQLLLWILYVDVNCRPMGLTISLMDYVLETGNPALQPDRLYRCARLWARCYWGKQYPDGEVADDMENYRALELLHEGMMLRHKLWKIFMEGSATTGINGTSCDAESLYAETMTMRDKYSDLFITAKLASAASTRRTLNTINMAVTTLYAQILFHRRLLEPSGPLTTLHRQAVRNIVEICRKQYISDPRLLRRLHWPLLTAEIDTEDENDRHWLRQRLFELKHLHTECAWAHEVAERFLMKQDVTEGRHVDLGTLLREYVQI